MRQQSNVLFKSKTTVAVLVVVVSVIILARLLIISSLCAYTAAYFLHISTLLLLISILEDYSLARTDTLSLS